MHAFFIIELWASSQNVGLLHVYYTMPLCHKHPLKYTTVVNSYLELGTVIYRGWMGIKRTELVLRFVIGGAHSSSISVTFCGFLAPFVSGRIGRFFPGECLHPSAS